MKLDDLILLTETRLESLFTLYLKKPQYAAPILQQAIQYSVLNGGKRVRPLLVYASGYALDVPWENLDAAACAIEWIHAYSLIHDDLPAMDNADLRRGKPSCHKKFNDAIAILAGDTLQPMAFDLIASHPSSLTAEQRLNMIHVLSHASGIEGMATGQALDLETTHTLESLTNMYRLKTGALLTACVKLSAAATHHPHAACLIPFTEAIGLAFQIQDDLLDIASSTESLGKPQGIDAINQKLTYPCVLGIEKSQQRVEELFEAALNSIEILGEKAQLLREFAHTLLQRKK